MKSAICLAILLCVATSLAHAWDSTRVSVPVVVNNHVIPYFEFAIFVEPKSPISLGFGDATRDAKVSFQGMSIDLAQAKLVAPDQPGLEILKIRNTASGEEIIINVFTLLPAKNLDSNEKLNGYSIGSYPKEPLNGLDIYLPPKGLVEVTATNQDVRVSPNFTLGQFVSKQSSDYPKYLVLRTALLLKLENILASLNNTGHAIPGIVIMSGYRTPFYNHAIGNVQYSRHVWGGAVDLYIDVSPQDGRMDDLNNDGKVDREDSRWLAEFISELSQRGEFEKRIGGLGVYGSTSAHGPFVHVDVRGSRARW